MSFFSTIITDTTAILQPSLDFIALPVDLETLAISIKVLKCFSFQERYIFCNNITRIQNLKDLPSLNITSDVVNISIPANEFLIIDANDPFTVFLRILNSSKVMIGSLATNNSKIALDFESLMIGVKKVGHFKPVYTALIFLGIGFGIMIGCIACMIARKKKSANNESILLTTNL